MSLRSGVLLLVALGAVAVAVSAEEEAKAGSLDKSFAMPAKGGDVIPVKIKVGSLMIDEIRLNNLPNEQEVKVAVANNSGDKSRPKIAVLISNPTPYKMKAKLVTSFEGADGTIYMSCDRKDGVKPYADSDRTNMCFFDSLKTRNWPKVKKVHLVAEISREH
jgi:hypothetical protein